MPDNFTCCSCWRSDAASILNPTAILLITWPLHGTSTPSSSLSIFGVDKWRKGVESGLTTINWYQTTCTRRTVSVCSIPWSLLIKHQCILFIYTYISFHFCLLFYDIANGLTCCRISFCCCIIFRPHILVWLVLRPFCCCFNRIENIKLSITWLIYLFWIEQWEQMANLAVYP
jgi:hypothetical protein